MLATQQLLVDILLPRNGFFPLLVITEVQLLQEFHTIVKTIAIPYAVNRVNHTLKPIDQIMPRIWMAYICQIK